MKKNRQKALRITALVCLVFLALFLVFQVININYKPSSTQVVEKTSVEKGIETKAFFVRDETYISSSSSDLFSVPLVNNGVRVAENECIVAQFGKKEDADSFIKMNKIKKQLERCEGIYLQNRIDISDINNYDRETDELFVSFITSLNNNDFSSMNEYGEDISDNITCRQITMGNELKLQEIISKLRSELSGFSALKPSYVYAKSTGYYLNETDGFENVIPYKDVLNVNADSVKKALSREVEKSDGYVGKIVNKFNWYIVCSVTMKDIENLKIGGHVTVAFKNSSVGSERMTVKAINVTDNNNVALVLESNSVNSKAFSLRREDIKIITDTVYGYAIDKDALRTVNGTLGVYVLKGRIVDFRYIDVIYTGDDYVLVRTYEDELSKSLENEEDEEAQDNKAKLKKSRRLREESDILINSEGNNEISDYSIEGDYIRLYDEVIVNGKNIYEGQLI